jgi:predicted RNA binding protein YcfA (HicA-like mRNA interferase family)
MLSRGKERAMKTSEMIKLLKKAGCKKIRDGGDHEIWYSPITNKQFPVWRHGKEIPTGTAEKIKKEAGV